MKTISIEDNTWSRLTILKVKSGMKNMDSLIYRLLVIGEKEILDG